MISRTIVLNAIEPALLSVRSPLGIDLDLDLTFLKQDQSPADPAALIPQLALLPRSSIGVFAYDIETTSSAGGTAKVSVPGSALVDFAGYDLELYARRVAENPNDPAVPSALLAKGVLRLEGSAYISWGPLSPLTVPVVVGPQGVQGPQGIQGQQGIQGPTGQRGSIWTTGSGPPPAATAQTLPGDMYLDESNGDVWRYDGATWVLGTF